MSGEPRPRERAAPTAGAPSAGMPSPAPAPIGPGNPSAVEADVRRDVEWIRARTALEPEVGLVLGSGLDGLADAVEEAWAAGFSDLPAFPRATAPGHPGRVTLGTLEGRTVCVLRGRLHYYEGHSMRQVAAGVRLIDRLGARVLILTNAAGVVNRRFAPGSLMLVADHLNLMWANPLVGRDPDEVRELFPDMSDPYDAGLRRMLRDVALRESIPLLEGVYAAVPGPSYETPAEIDFLRRFGADAVGMSTVPEAIAARELGMRVAAISCLTNLAAGLAGARLDHTDVLRAGAEVRPRLERLVRAFLRRLE